MLVTMMSAHAAPNRIAPRYCLRAKCLVIHQVTGKPIGEFTCYDKTPDISSSVFAACSLYCDTFQDQPLECSAVELVLFEHCPVECRREVVFTEFLQK